MKNDDIIQAYQKIEPDEAAQNRMLRQILDQSESDRSIQAQAKSGGRRVRKENTMKKTLKWLAPVAACLVLVAAIQLINGGRTFNSDSEIDLPNSNGNVSASYITGESSMNLSSKADLVWLTEEEIFNYEDSVIFYGTVKEIRNIAVNIGSMENYWAIAKIKVSEVYRGELNQGDVISVQLHCPISEDVWIEDTEVISQIREGMSGIFMPKRYSESDYWEEGGAKLILSDLSDYGFSDGERFAFLETSEGLIYAKWAFPSIPEHAAMDDVKALIVSHID